MEEAESFTIPNIQTLGKKSLQELRNLAIAEVAWDYNNISRICFTLNDRQTCSTSYILDKAHYKFDPKTKITDVEVIISESEGSILQINFFHEHKRIVHVAYFLDDEDLRVHGGGRREIFWMTEDEQLIGLKLHKDERYGLIGITWIKRKIIKDDLQTFKRDEKMK